MRCAEGTCEHNAYSITVRRLKQELAADQEKIKQLAELVRDAHEHGMACGYIKYNFSKLDYPFETTPTYEKLDQILKGDK